MSEFGSFEQLERAFHQRAEAVRPAMEQAVTEHTATVFQYSEANLNRLIYGRPIPQRSYSWRYKVRRTRGDGTTFTTKTFHPRKGAPADVILGKEKWTQTEKGAERARERGQQHGRQAGRGRGEWTRTNNLRRAETMRVELERLTGIIQNTAPYALPRHDLGLPTGDPEAFYGSRRRSDRVAPWRKRAVAEFEPQRLEHYSRALRRALQRV